MSQKKTTASVSRKNSESRQTDNQTHPSTQRSKQPLPVWNNPVPLAATRQKPKVGRGSYALQYYEKLARADAGAEKLTNTSISASDPNVCTDSYSSKLVGRKNASTKPSLTVTQPVNYSLQRFDETCAEMKEKAVKYSTMYSLESGEDSSSEEEIDNDAIFKSMLVNYSDPNVSDTNSNDTNNVGDTLRRTYELVEDSAKSTCLICISTIKMNASIWNCSDCYESFHLDCIQRWAKDLIASQVCSNQQTGLAKPIFWNCPKCRREYDKANIPTVYKCYCGKVTNPEFSPWNAPHSCGENCHKPLVPNCGHTCTILCHPGACPPCPATVQSACHCGKEKPRTVRCINKSWSCLSTCGKMLECKIHNCEEKCHSGSCNDCNNYSLRLCVCGRNRKRVLCSVEFWKCDEICGRQLSCGIHTCMEVCHQRNLCGPCPLAEPRTCPCGKAEFNLPCTQNEVPLCADTCGKPLDCGIHFCVEKCHRGECGKCLQMVTKSCRCGTKHKEYPCSKDFTCDVKCKLIRDCTRHPCGRKCCNGECPPCENICRRPLGCGNHKCEQRCHQGSCFPCDKESEITCRCGEVKISVKCGMEKQIKPPKCELPCKLMSHCHHSNDTHPCHYGECPKCAQVCGKLIQCGHACEALCHENVRVKIPNLQKPAGPWEKNMEKFEVKALPCPDCKVPVEVMCLGEHETTTLPCSAAVITSCGKPCGRLLSCGTHTCTYSCHKVLVAEDHEDACGMKAGSNCEVCIAICGRPRENGCPHRCDNTCHLGECEPCTKKFNRKCHCGLNMLYLECAHFFKVNNMGKERLLSCKGCCPKPRVICQHPCMATCHSGPCPVTDCKTLVPVFCKCRKVRKQVECYNSDQVLDCKDTCTNDGPVRTRGSRRAKHQSSVANVHGQPTTPVPPTPRRNLFWNYLISGLAIIIIVGGYMWFSDYNELEASAPLPDITENEVKPPRGFWN